VATDYDALRCSEIDEVSDDSIEELNIPQRSPAGHRECRRIRIGPNPSSCPTHLSGEELSVRVVPRQADEFVCSICFLVHHRIRLPRDPTIQAAVGHDVRRPEPTRLEPRESTLTGGPQHR